MNIPPYMALMLTNIMPEMIAQLETGVDQYRICEMTEFLNGTIDHDNGVAIFKYNEIEYKVLKHKDSYWKI